MGKLRATAPPSLEDEAPLLTADDLAAWFRCSRRAVYDRVFRNQIPGVVRLGRRLYFDRVAVQAWLERRDGEAG